MVGVRSRLAVTCEPKMFDFDPLLAVCHRDVLAKIN